MRTVIGSAILAAVLGMGGCAMGQGYPYSYLAADGCNTVTAYSPTRTEVTMAMCNVGDPLRFLGVLDPREKKLGPIGSQRNTIQSGGHLWGETMEPLSAWIVGSYPVCIYGYPITPCWADPIGEFSKPWEPLHPLVEIEPPVLVSTISTVHGRGLICRFYLSEITRRGTSVCLYK